MLSTPSRHCRRIRHLNGLVASSNCTLGHIVTAIAHARNYAKDKSCCPDMAQTEGRRVEPWPRTDPPPAAWRCECPREPQPPNYDPYRIKVPDVVVPPLPASNVKWTGVVFTVDRESKQASPSAAQQAGAEQPGAGQLEDEAEEQQEKSKEEGFFSTLKSYFGFGKNKKGGSDVSIIGKSEVPTEDGREPLKSPDIKVAMNANLQDLFHDSPIVHPDYWKEKTKKPIPAVADTEVFPRLGYHGKSKYKYAFHEPWRPLDRLTLIAQAEKEEGEMGAVIETAENTSKQVT